MDWKVVELGHSPAPPAAARGSRQRPLRVGPYSRALITATAPPPGNSPAANVPGGGGEWPGLAELLAASAPAAASAAAAAAAATALPLANS